MTGKNHIFLARVCIGLCAICAALTEGFALKSGVTISSRTLGFIFNCFLIAYGTYLINQVKKHEEKSDVLPLANVTLKWYAYFAVICLPIFLLGVVSALARPWLVDAADISQVSYQIFWSFAVLFALCRKPRKRETARQRSPQLQTERRK